VPQGTPNVLIPFIILIESIRNIIRPITLTIRLTANIIAGHLLITLLSRLGVKLINILIPLLLFIQLILLILESAVAIIQSYVFAILVTLYFREI
jgi:F-type H+-transporting ATPase subunit a